MLIQNGDKLINTRNWSELVKPEQLARDPKSTEMYGKFVCEPLERGFATTIGNSLRRVLLSSLQGAAIVAAMQNGLAVRDYSARMIKQAVVGYGQAEKIQVQHMVRILLGLSASPSADAADALAVAICHANTLRI